MFLKRTDSAMLPITCPLCDTEATRQHILCPHCGAELPHIGRERFFTWFQATAFCLLAVSPIAVSVTMTTILRHTLYRANRGFGMGMFSENLPAMFVGFFSSTLIFGGAAALLYVLVRWIAQVRNSVDGRCDRLVGLIVISLPVTILTGCSAAGIIVIVLERSGASRAGFYLAWAVGLVAGLVTFVGFVVVVSREIMALRQGDRMGNAPVERVVLCPNCRSHLVEGQVICATCGTDLREQLAAPPSAVTISNPWFWMCAAIPLSNIFFWLVFIPSAMTWGPDGIPVFTAQALPPGMLAMAYCGYQFLKGLRANYLADVEAAFVRAAAIAARNRSLRGGKEAAEPVFDKA